MRGQSGYPLARGDDAGEVERVRRADGPRAGRARLAPHGAELSDRLGQGELLARHPGDEPAAPDLPSRLEPAIDQQQVAPRRRTRFPLEQPAEHDPVAAEERAGAVLERGPADIR